LGGEHQLSVLPRSAHAEAFLGLRDAMPAECVDRLLGERDAAPRAYGLRLHDAEAVRRRLHRSADLQRAGVDVDITPAETEQLALPHAGGDREDVQSFQSVAGGGIEECARLLSRQRRDLEVAVAGRIDEVGDVAMDQSPANGVRERFVDQGVDVVDGRRREAGFQPRRVQSLQVLRTQPCERQGTDLRDHMEADELLVADERARTERRPHGIEPLREELTDGLSWSGDERPLVARVECTGQLARDLGARPAEEVLAPAACGGHRRAPAAVGPLVHGPFTVGSFSHRPSPFRGTSYIALRADEVNDDRAQSAKSYQSGWMVGGSGGHARA
jgi:hypothetical protein